MHANKSFNMRLEEVCVCGGGGGGDRERCRVIVNKDQTRKQSDINTSNIAVLSSKRGGWG